MEEIGHFAIRASFQESSEVQRIITGTDLSQKFKYLNQCDKTLQSVIKTLTACSGNGISIATCKQVTDYAVTWTFIAEATRLQE